MSARHVGENQADVRERATSGGVRDCWLGGKDHSEADRIAADAITAIAPWFATGARASRSFLRRTVIHMITMGIEQVLVIGCGPPLEPDLHQIARVHRPRAHVLYVGCNPQTGPAALARFATGIHDQGSLNLTQPTGVVMIDVLEHLNDDDAAHLLSMIRQVSTSGSYLAIAQ